MGVFIQQVINGLSIGSIYALMAVGYSLVYSILNFSNFAHGGVIMLGAYFGLYAVNLLGLPFLGALIIPLCGREMLRRFTLSFQPWVRLYSLRISS